MAIRMRSDDDARQERGGDEQAEQLGRAARVRQRVVPEHQLPIEPHPADAVGVAQIGEQVAGPRQPAECERRRDGGDGEGRRNQAASAHEARSSSALTQTWGALNPSSPRASQTTMSR